MHWLYPIENKKKLYCRPKTSNYENKMPPPHKNPSYPQITDVILNKKHAYKLREWLSFAKN